MRQWRPSSILQTRRSIANRVAHRARTPILRRVLPDLAALSPAEAHGFIRARAGRLIACYTDLLLTEIGGDDRQRADVASLAKNHAVAMVMQDFRQASAVPMRPRKAA